MDAAVERQQMVLAERIELHVAHDHRAFALGREHAVADCRLEAGRVAADEVTQGFCVALRRGREAVARNVLAEILDDRANVLGDPV